jgi:putative FmdB family regulatory protein
MPIYEYVCRTDQGCAHCRDGFDVLQRLADAELTTCPKCGAAIARRISAPQVVSGDAHRQQESHLAKHGFTQYRRAGQGVYEKTAGKGPAYISDDGQ